MRSSNKVRHGRSRCDNGFCACVTCDMRTYEKKFRARTLSRVELYNSQLELRDSLLCRAASELVSRAVGSALGSIANSHDPCTHLLTIALHDGRRHGSHEA